MTDAILLTWCATLKKDKAYIVLNVFWILVAVVGIARASGWLGDCSYPPICPFYISIIGQMYFIYFRLYH
jgi:hypothetical protein